MRNILTVPVTDKTLDDLVDTLNYIGYLQGHRTRAVADELTEDEVRALLAVSVELSAVVACYEMRTATKLTDVLVEAVREREARDSIPNIRGVGMRIYRPQREKSPADANVDRLLGRVDALDEDDMDLDCACGCDDDCGLD